VCRYYRLEKLLILCLHPRCWGSIFPGTNATATVAVEPERQLVYEAPAAPGKVRPRTSSGIGSLLCVCSGLSSGSCLLVCVWTCLDRLASASGSELPLVLSRVPSETTATPSWDAPGRLLCSALSCSIQLVGGGGGGQRSSSPANMIPAPGAHHSQIEDENRLGPDLAKNKSCRTPRTSNDALDYDGIACNRALSALSVCSLRWWCGGIRSLSVCPWSRGPAYHCEGKSGHRWARDTRKEPDQRPANKQIWK
jgi:hypothetical protein